jgi:hypothetical protein
VVATANQVVKSANFKKGNAIEERANLLVEESVERRFRPNKEEYLRSCREAIILRGSTLFSRPTEEEVDFHLRAREYVIDMHLAQFKYQESIDRINRGW